MKTHTARFCWVLAATLVTPALKADGLYWESSTVTGTGSSPTGKVAKTYAMPKKLRREDGDSVLIMRLDMERLYVLRTKDKAYSEISFPEIEEAVKQIKEEAAAQLAKLKARLKDLPPDKRAAAEKQIESNPYFRSEDIKLEVTKSDAKKDVLGRACTRLVGKEAGKEVMSAWITTEIKEFANLRADWVDAMKRVTLLNAMVGRSRTAFYDKVDGFPMETELGGQRTVVTKVEAKDIPDSEFEVPSDYKREDPPLTKKPLPRQGAPEVKKPDGGGTQGGQSPGKDKGVPGKQK